MPLILLGSGQVQLASNKISYIEMYQNEAYTFPILIKDRNLSSIDCTGWDLSISAKWYRARISYDSESPRSINPEGAKIPVHYPEQKGPDNPIFIEVEDLEFIFPQPNIPEQLIVRWTDPENGEGFLYVPKEISSRTEATTPKLENYKGWIGVGSCCDRSTASTPKELIINPVLLVVVTITITRTNELSGLLDITREPFGIIIRYQ